MLYYKRHLGDYVRDTAHLSLIEVGAYDRLLDRYYITERPIPADQAHRVAMARTKEERAAVDVVLAEFFTLIDGAYHNRRADLELLAMQAANEKNRTNGKRGGRPRKANANPEETEQKPSGFSVGSDPVSQKEPEGKGNHKPLTINQEKTKPLGTLPSAEKVIPEGFGRFWAAWPKTERKVGKGKCLAIWQRKGLEPQADWIAAHVEAMKSSRQWRDGYDPRPESFLNGEQWPAQGETVEIRSADSRDSASLRNPALSESATGHRAEGSGCVFPI